jgi:hypothetical protein
MEPPISKGDLRSKSELNLKIDYYYEYSVQIYK